MTLGRGGFVDQRLFHLFANCAQEKTLVATRSGAGAAENGVLVLVVKDQRASKWRSAWASTW